MKHSYNVFALFKNKPAWYKELGKTSKAFLQDFWDSVTFQGHCYSRRKETTSCAAFQNFLLRAYWDRKKTPLIFQLYESMMHGE